MMLPPDPSAQAPAGPPPADPAMGGGVPGGAPGGLPGFPSTDPMGALQFLAPLVGQQHQEQGMLAQMQMQASMSALAAALGDSPNPAGYAAQSEPILPPDPGADPA